MEITGEKVLKMIDGAIINNKTKVIDALKKSYVKVDDNISDRDLSSLVRKELNTNGYLIFHLGEVLDDTFDMNSEDMSNSIGDIGDWLGENKEVIGFGATMLGKFFGGGGDDVTPAPTGTGGGDQSTMMLEYRMAQDQAESRRRDAEDRRRDDEAKRRSSNMMIFGIIGAVVVIGGIITTIIVVNKKK